MLPVVAIVGRPNVGKSTLFNRLVGSRQALVHNRPGVTRDRNYGTAIIEDREVVLIDTGGLDVEPDDDLFDAIRIQAQAAIDEADVIVFVVDRTSGISPADHMTAKLLRKRAGTSTPVLVAVNKCDGHKHDDDAAEFWELGPEQLYCISAAHGRGIGDLSEAIAAKLPAPVQVEDAAPVDQALDEGWDQEWPDGPDAYAEEDPYADYDPDAPLPPLDAEPVAWSPDEYRTSGLPDEIRVAIIGRPNIGKSTLVNRLIGEDRHVVHDAPGTTMDAIDSVVEVEGQTWRIVDTAGVRRKARIDDKVETFATSRAIRTIERCHVTLLMVNGEEPITNQDARLASLVVDRGRALVILVNRWDKVRDDPERNVRVVQDEIAQSLPHVNWAPQLYISALTGKGCHRILDLAAAAYRAFDARVPTSVLNRFLADALYAHSPPQKHNHPVRLNYMTQTRVRPPTFVIWANSPEAVHETYKRFLEGRLRDAFGFEGTPLRLYLRKKRRPGERR